MTQHSETELIVLQSVCDVPSKRSENSGPTVYFDGSCPLCTFEIGHYASQTGGNHLNFVDVSQEGPDLGSDLSADAAMRRFHVRLADGRLLSGARAFVAIWNTLPRWRWAARIAQIPGVTLALEGVYRLFLPVRPVMSMMAARLGARAKNPR